MNGGRLRELLTNLQMVQHLASTSLLSEGYSQGTAQLYLDRNTAHDAIVSEFTALRQQRDRLAEACQGIETIYAEYMGLGPDAATRSFDLVLEAVREARAALASIEAE